MKTVKQLWQEDSQHLQRFLSAYDFRIKDPQDITDEMIYRSEQNLSEAIDNHEDKHGYFKNVKHAYDYVAKGTQVMQRWLSDGTGHFSFQDPKAYFVSSGGVEELVEALIDADPIGNLVLDKKGIAILVSQGIVVIPDHEINSSYDPNDDDEFDDEFDDSDFLPLSDCSTHDADFLRPNLVYDPQEEEELEINQFPWTRMRFQQAIYESFVSASFYQIRGDWGSTGCIGPEILTPEGIKSDLLEHNIRNVYEHYAQRQFSNLHDGSDILYYDWVHETLFNWQNQHVFDQQTRAAFESLLPNKIPAQVAAMTNYKIENGIVIPSFEGYNKQKRQAFYEQ